MRLVDALTVTTALGLSTVTVATADEIIAPYPAGRPYYPLNAIEDTASPSGDASSPLRLLSYRRRYRCLRAIGQRTHSLSPQNAEVLGKSRS